MFIVTTDDKQLTVLLKTFEKIIQSNINFYFILFSTILPRQFLNISAASIYILEIVKSDVFHYF